ncbi:IS5/IS1182 family transposase, partial [Xanthomonas campestris pv. campestris]
MRMRQKTYPSDMSREQFEHVLPILEQGQQDG